MRNFNLSRGHFQFGPTAALFVLCALCALWPQGASAGQVAGDPQRGFDILINTPMTQPVLTLDELDRIWTVWEPDARAKAEAASPEERHRMIFERYGFVERDFDDSGLPLGYTLTKDGKALETNCFSCHGGRVAGKTVPGAANVYQDLSTLNEDIALLRGADRGYALTRDRVPQQVHWNFASGYTNAFTFSVVLSRLRNEDMDRGAFNNVGQPVDHDEDAPAWWTYKKKERIYWTGFAHPTPRTLMQFITVPGNSGEFIRGMEDNFKDIQAYIKSLEPPAYPYPIDRDLAAKGKMAFERVCSTCHGKYGDEPSYPNKVVDIDKVQTDPLRLHAIPQEWKEFYNRSWMTNYGRFPFELEPNGYLAPPLDGIWASAPYMHNGSIPTLYHVLNSDDRPDIWTRSETGYDSEHVGLKIQEYDAVPDGLPAPERRTFFNTANPGAGNQGHYFPDDELTDEEKVQVLEYLKTL